MGYIEFRSQNECPWKNACNFGMIKDISIKFHLIEDKVSLNKDLKVVAVFFLHISENFVPNLFFIF